MAVLNDDSPDAPRLLERTNQRGGPLMPLLCMAIGVYAIAFPEAMLDDPAWAKLPKRSFGMACGLLFLSAGIAYATRQLSDGKEFRAMHGIRMICGSVAVGAGIYMLKCIVEVGGWPG